MLLQVRFHAVAVDPSIAYSANTHFFNWILGEIREAADGLVPPHALFAFAALRRIPGFSYFAIGDAFFC